MLRSSLRGRRGRWRRTRDYVKLLWRALYHRRQSRRWIGFLNATPFAREVLRLNCRLIRKIYSPYQTRARSCQDRLDALIAHHELLLRHGLDGLAVEAMKTQVPLGAFSGKSESMYTIRLSAAVRHETEGEMALLLYAGEQVVYSLVFTICGLDRRPAIMVGALQGPSRVADGLGLIQQITRDLHGLRPKNLMIRCIQKLAQDLGCDNLLLVGNRNRVIDYAIRKGHLHADYDQFWLELGARERGDGDFILPCAIAPLDLEAIPSKKRAEARRRAALLDQALSALGRSVAQWRAPQEHAAPR